MVVISSATGQAGASACSLVLSGMHKQASQSVEENPVREMFLQAYFPLTGLHVNLIAPTGKILEEDVM